MRLKRMAITLDNCRARVRELEALLKRGRLGPKKAAIVRRQARHYRYVARTVFGKEFRKSA